MPGSFQVLAEIKKCLINSKEDLLLGIGILTSCFCSFSIVYYLIVPFEGDTFSKFFWIQVLATFGSLYLSIDFIPKFLGYIFRKIGWLDA